ncbi:MAG: Uridine nucleosidase 1 [Bogoriella megaspora]|nr:MAG: Uridine nucleosidase 1 [Bogoriella megaspora]
MAPAIDTPNAVEAMYIALKSCPPGTPWLVATGALTNIAVLFLLHPDLTLHIAGLSIMGGVIGGGFTDAKLGTTTYGSESFGNWTPYAEFNIFCDPEAAQSIFSNATLAAKTTLIPLDITHLALATSSVRSKLLYSTPNGTTSTPSRIRRMFHDLLIFFARTYCDVFGLTEGPPLHDPLAIVVIFASELFTIGDEGGERFSVDVVREDLAQTSRGNPKAVSQCGRTVARKAAKGEAGITIPRGLKVEAFWDIVGQCLVRAEKG